MDAEVATHRCAELGFSIDLPSGWGAGKIPCEAPWSFSLSSTGLVGPAPEAKPGLDREQDGSAGLFEDLGLWFAGRYG